LLLITHGDSCYNAPIKNTEYSKNTTKDDEVEITDLPELSASRSHRSTKLSRTMLGWQRSINRRSWRLAGAISTGLLALVALLMIFSSLHNTLTPPPGKPSQYSTPTIHYDYIYRDHPTAIYPGHFDEVLTVAWSPDGTRIASGEHDSTVQIWDTRTGKHLFTYPHHFNTVYSVAWSPNGTRIVSGSYDGTVQIWNAEGGKVVYTLRNGGLFVAWSPDSSMIASGGKDGIVKIWQAASLT
jgi:WD40 repeat protein